MFIYKFGTQDFLSLCDLIDNWVIDELGLCQLIQAYVVLCGLMLTKEDLCGLMQRRLMAYGDLCDDLYRLIVTYVTAYVDLS